MKRVQTSFGQGAQIGPSILSVFVLPVAIVEASFPVVQTIGPCLASGTNPVLFLPLYSL